MVRRSRYLILLCLVLVLIYIQQSSVLHAEQESTESQTEERGPEEGESEEEEPEEEEPEEPIRKFSLEIPEPSGANGYYTHKPEVRLTHESKRGVTRYRLTAAGDVTAEGKLEKEEMIIREFAEGENHLQVWMEDEEQNKVEGYEEKVTLKIDTQAPELRMDVSGGGRAWHREKAEIYAEAVDPVSGIEKIGCFTEGELTGQTEKSKTVFTIRRSSTAGQAVTVMVTARDQAGNESRRTEKVHIDGQAPIVQIKGASDYLITSRPVALAYEVDEENILAETQEETVWENVDGQRSVLTDGTWVSHGTKKILERTLREDGVYRMRLQAKDQAGHRAESELQVIIDQKNPIIRKIDQLQGKYMKKFSWNYPAGEWIFDFTTYVYEIRLDGRLYPAGEEVTEEGWHSLEVRAEDAAGNTATAKAGFVIDHSVPTIQFLDVEDGKRYEEKVTFRVKTEKKEDQIDQIWVNGERQRTDPGKAAYQYTLEEYGNYEVRVKASDRAGNQTEESILFQVTEKKNPLQKIADPLIRRLGLSEQKNSREEGKEREERRKASPWIIGSMFMTAGIAGGGGWLIWRKRNRKR